MSGKVEAGCRPARGRPGPGPGAGRPRGARPPARPGPGSRARTPRTRGRATWRSACSRVKRGAPSGSGSRSGQGLAPKGEGGLAAASTKSSMGSPPPGGRGDQVLAVIGREALDRPAVPPDQGLGPEPGRAGVADARTERHLGRPAHSVGMSPLQAEPGGVPGRAPRPADAERLVLGGEGLGGGDGFAVARRRPPPRGAPTGRGAAAGRTRGAPGRCVRRGSSPRGARRPSVGEPDRRPARCPGRGRVQALRVRMFTTDTPEPRPPTLCWRAKPWRMAT